jgi:hypothetical protein
MVWTLDGRFSFGPLPRGIYDVSVADQKITFELDHGIEPTPVRVQVDARACSVTDLVIHVP